VETLLYDVADGLATITLNRPEALNAITPTMCTELPKALGEAAGDESVRCVVLTGAGRGFCAGADLRAFSSTLEAGGAPPIADFLRTYYHPIVMALVQMDKPVVAAVNGAAAGAGMSLALACDFRIASEHAKFYQAFIKIGLIPDSGSTHFLPQIVGLAKAKELALLAPIVGADEALRIGLVTEVVKADAFEARWREFAAMLASGPTRAFALAKKALHFGAQADIAQALDFEADQQQAAALTTDYVEGVTAFLDKRDAKFQGR
jgi:2-(1,2-epoxy-1,2-dihydrophenyl)acetyl-CoA isomerase